MITLAVWGLAIAVVVAFFAALLHNGPRREKRLADSGDSGYVPWMDSGGASSDCSGSDAGCGGDGGGGGGGD